MDLASRLKGTVCIVGVGNRLRGDDAAGPALIDLLRGRTSAICVDAGVAPENVAEKIARMQPDVVLVADAVDFRGLPGEVRLLPPARLGGGRLSTHAGSLRLFCDYLRLRTGADLLLLAIQPACMGMDAPLSRGVRQAVESVAENIRASARY